MPRPSFCLAQQAIRADFLEQIVLADIKRITKFAKLHEEGFAALLMQNTMQDAKQRQKAKQDQLKMLIARDKELDILFQKVYEDQAMGKISEERFAKMAWRYEDEQATLSGKIDKLDAEIRKSEDKCGGVEDFIRMVRKHSSILKLTPDVLHQFIDYIKVFHTEKIEGMCLQRV